MKKRNKLLYLLPLSLLMFGCKKTNDKTKTKDVTTNKPTTINTIKTTTAKTTTEEDVFDILVYKNIEDAATIKGEGIFNLNSSTTITITPNYGYEFVGLYNGTNLLTEELTYEVKDIKESITLIAMFKPINYMVSVEQNIEEAGTINGVGEIPYNTSTTIDANLEEEYLFVALYNGEELLTEELPYTIEKVTGPLNLTAVFKQKTYDVVVEQSLEDAAIISGVGSFIKGSNTTLTIKTNDGYNYLGLYDGENLLTEEATYEVKDITENVTLTALFSANSYNVTTSSDNELLGTVKLIDGSYDCGSIIELEATPIEGYKVEGWYVNDEYYGTGNTINFKVPAYNSIVVAKFTIITYSITVTDNIDGLSRCYLEGNLYNSSDDFSFDWHSYAYYDIYNVLGYDFDYVLINGEKCDSDCDNLYMDRDYTLEIFYKLADMEFYLLYDRDKLSVNNGISVDILPDDYETGVIDNEYSEFDGCTYLSGTYKYQSVINITLNIKTNYYLDGLYNGDEKIGTIENNVITLTIDNDYNYIYINFLGKICHITVMSADEVTGSASGTGDYHYGNYANILAIPNKGYKFIKWVDEDGNDYGVIYGYEHDVAPADYDVPLYGDATYIAVFVPDEFDCKYMFVTNDENKTKSINTMMLTYLSEYEIEAIEYAGYTFVGWLENEDIESLFSTERVLNYTMINEESKIYAYYTPNTYNVTLDFNGGTGSITSMEALYDNEFITEVPTKEKYTFAGYYSFYNEKTYIIEEEHSGNQIQYYFRNKEGNYNWLITNGYMLINGVAATSSSQTLYAGDVIKIVDHVSNNLVVNRYGIGIYNVPRDAKLVAKWMIGVTYLNYDGTPCYEEITLVEIGATAANYHCSKERDGYDYAYWTYNNERFDFDTPLTENITLVAYYQAHKHNLKITKSSGVDSYTINGTTYSSTQTLVIDYDTVLNISCTPKNGYTFSYWDNTTLNVKYYDKDLVYVMIDQDIFITIKTMAYCLDISVNDSVYGTTDPSPTTFYSEYVSYGNFLTVTATPNEGYAFEAWYNADTNELLTNDSAYTFTPSEFDYDYTTGVNFKFYIKAVFGRIKTDKYERLGNKVWFGYYPQTCLNTGLQDGKYLDLINELKGMAGTLPTLDTKANYAATKDNTDWIKYDDYYFYVAYPWNDGTSIENAPHMWYIDIDYDGDGRYDYRGVLIYNYRTDEISSSKSPKSTDNTHQDDNHYSSNSNYRTYWFKYELIEWDVLENNDGTVKLIANLAIDSQNFSLSSNNYDSSYIRSFLNDDFYNTAFNTLEKSIMKTMTIGSNSDYVALLSEEEVTSYFANNTDRWSFSTDYAKSQNSYTYVPPSIYNRTYEDNCYWLTRSAYTESGKIYYIDYSGTITNGKTNMTYYGIRPVITITL